MTTFRKAIMVSTGGALLSALAPVSFAQYGDETPNLLPHNPQAGQCYARVKHDAKYAADSEIVVVEEGYQSASVTQAVLQASQRSVKVKDESVRYVVRQPQYSTQQERIMISPDYDKLSVVPPQFQTITETVQISSPRRVWKKGNPGHLAAQGYNILSTANGGYSGSTQLGGGYASHGRSGGTDVSALNNQCGSTCEIWCLVEEPGETVGYQRKVMTQPARVTRTTVPARYQNVTKQVLIDPGGVDTIPVPAQYRDVAVKELVAPARQDIVNIPPVMGRIDTKVMVEGERYEWRRVICNTGQVVGHNGGAISYPEASDYGLNSGTSYSSHQYSDGYDFGTTGTTGYSAPTRHGYTVYDGHSNAAQSGGHQSGSYQTGASHDDGASNYGGSWGYASSGITYGGLDSAAAYQNKQPSALIYGSTSDDTVSYGADYHSPSTPRHYGGEGMNAHHSASQAWPGE